MKKILILLVTILAVACSKDDNKINNNNNNNNSGGGGNTSTPTVQYDNLSVATQTLTFTTLSSTQNLTITAGSGSYSATVVVPIVNVKVVSNTLEITSVATGTTTITVVDTKSQQKAEIPVVVKTLYTVDANGTITHSDRHNFADDTDLVLSDVKAVADGVFKGFGEFKSITTNGVENFGKLAFASCQQVENITLKGVKYIGVAAFQFNSSVKTVTITGVNDSELKIAKEGFATCALLETVVLPAQTKEIGGNAFLQCRQLTVVKCAAIEAPKVFRTTFPSLIAGTERVLYVPKGSKEKYEADANWKDKFSRIEETDF